MSSNPFAQTWSPAQSGQWRPQPGQQAPGYQGYYNPSSNYGGTAYQTQQGQFTPFWQGVRYQYLQNQPNAVWSMFTSPFAVATIRFPRGSAHSRTIWKTPTPLRSR